MLAGMRLEGQIEKTESCWIWRGPVDERGRARAHFEGKNQYIARILWLSDRREPISPTAHLVRLCPVNLCVNPNHHAIDKTGVRTSLTRRFWERVEKTDTCWLWLGKLNDAGYGRVTWNGRVTRAHRVSWILFHGEIPEGLIVLHACDTRRCVNPAHLSLGTQMDNVRDMHNKGRNVAMPVRKGSRHPRAKLSEEDALTIRREMVGLSRRFGVSMFSLYDIGSGRSWKHLPPLE